MADSAARQYLFAHVCADTGGWAALHDRLSPVLAEWSGATVMGVFMGLFGVRNQDLFILVSLPVGADSAQQLRARLPADVQLRDVLPMRATVRPLTDAPLTRAGIHVFRFFDVAAGDVDEVAALSKTAWETFERSDDYASEPMGLFRFDDPQVERGRMLLLTWYRDLTSWERSRTPHPEATANFRKRAALSRSAIAYATRLAQTMPR